METQIWVNIGSGNGLLLHEAIIGTKFDLPSVRSSDIHLRATSHEIPYPLITELSLKITYLQKFNPNLPAGKELIHNNKSD